MAVGIWPQPPRVALWGGRAEVHIQLLGRFRVWVRGTPIEDHAWRLRKARTLVQLLALAPGFRLHREQVMDALWSGLPPRAASHNLRVTLHAALQALATGPIDPRRLLDRDGDVLALAPLSPACTDVESFEAAALAARTGDEPDPFHTALDLYAGDLLSEDLYEESFQDRRSLLRDTYGELVDGIVRLYESRRDHDAALAVVQRALTRAPSSESLYAHAMRLHALAGRPDLALRRYETLRAVLERDDAEPHTETHALHDAIRSGHFGRLADDGSPKLAVRSDNVSPRPLPAAFSDVVVLGRYGQRTGEFNQPFDVAVDATGKLFVADHRNHRIQVFDSDGQFVATWGAEGSRIGELRGPLNLGVGPDGLVYVADCFNHRVQAFTTGGTWVRSWGNFGHGPGEFNFPTAIAVDCEGSVYVGDQEDGRVQKFSPEGEVLTSWGSLGTAPGQFRHVGGIAASPHGQIYVADYGNDRVQQFTVDGSFVRTWGRYGTADGEFRRAGAVAVDPAGDVYVSDVQNGRIQKFTADGQFLSKWGRPGDLPAEFSGPRGLATDDTGTLYVCETGQHRIQRFVAGPQVLMRSLVGFAAH